MPSTPWHSRRGPNWSMAWHRMSLPLLPLPCCRFRYCARCRSYKRVLIWVSTRLVHLRRSHHYQWRGRRKSMPRGVVLHEVERARRRLEWLGQTDGAVLERVSAACQAKETRQMQRKGAWGSSCSTSISSESVCPRNRSRCDLSLGECRVYRFICHLLIVFPMAGRVHRQFIKV